MIGFVVRRLAAAVISFFLVSVIIFTMMHQIPGGPFDGGDMPLPEAVRAQLEARYGLNGPVWQQYLNYMAGVLQGDFGVPFQAPGETVISLLSQAWWPSLVLGGLAC